MSACWICRVRVVSIAFCPRTFFDRLPFFDFDFAECEDEGAETDLLWVAFADVVFFSAAFARYPASAHITPAIATIIGSLFLNPIAAPWPLRV